MTVCSKCEAPLDSRYRFCGVCGTSVEPSRELIIDGKKNRRLKRFFRQALSSPKRPAVFFVLWFFAFSFFLWYLLQGIQGITTQSAEAAHAMNQLSQKIKYLKEGVSWSYAAKEIQFLADYASEWLYAVSGGVLSLFSLFYLAFFGRCIFLRIKHREEYFYKQPLAFGKLCVPVSKVLFVLCSVFLVIILLILVIKIGIGVV